MMSAVALGALLGVVTALGFLVALPRLLDGRKRCSVLWVGSDGRASTSKFQFYIWTAVGLFSYVQLYTVKALGGDCHPLEGFPRALLIAMGMSTLTLVSAKAITTSLVSGGKIDKSTDSANPLGGLIQDDAGQPELMKIQLLAWTAIAVVVYLLQVFTAALARKCELPDLDSSLVALMGLGHGAYLGKKLVTTDTPRLTSLSPSRVLPGMIVTITGLSLGDENSSQLTLDGVPFLLPITTWTDTQIVFTVPQSPTYNGVQRRLGVSANGVGSANDLTLSIHPAPIIKSVAPSLAKAGELVTISGDLIDANGVILLGSTPVSPMTWTPTTTTFAVPQEKAAGKPWVTGDTIEISVRSSTNIVSDPVILNIG
jgi:IPT/TIG domain